MGTQPHFNFYYANLMKMVKKEGKTGKSRVLEKQLLGIESSKMSFSHPKNT